MTAFCPIQSIIFGQFTLSTVLLNALEVEVPVKLIDKHDFSVIKSFCLVWLD